VADLILEGVARVKGPAKAAERGDPFTILASDVDEKALRMAKQNARAAGFRI